MSKVVKERDEGAAALVGRITSGDEQAKEELVQLYLRGVSVFIRRRVRNPADAEDLVQETFRVALASIGRLREPEKLTGFLLGIGRKLVSKYYREARPERNVVDLDEVQLRTNPASGQYEELLRKEEAEIVRQVIGELKMERDRQVLTRYFVCDEDKEQICQDLRLDSVHFDKVIHRARERFGKLYKKALVGKTPEKKTRQ